MEMDTETLLVPVKSVVQSLAVVLCGFLLARYRLRTPASTVTDMNIIITNCLLPCMIMTKLANTLTLELLERLWIIPVSAISLLVIGLVIGNIGARCVARQYRPLLVCAVSFNNAVGLPLPVLLAMVPDLARIFDDPDITYDRATSYVFMYSLVMATAMWAIAPYILKLGHRTHTDGIGPLGGSNGIELVQTLQTQGPVVQSPVSPAQIGGSGPVVRARRRVDGGAEGGADLEQGGTGSAGGSGSGSRSGFSLCACLQRRLNPPLMAYLTGGFLGTCAPARHAVRGTIVFNAMDFVSASAVPMTLVALGATMAAVVSKGKGKGEGKGAGGEMGAGADGKQGREKPPPTATAAAAATTPTPESAAAPTAPAPSPAPAPTPGALLPRSVVAIVVVSKLLLLPLAGLALLRLAARLGILPTDKLLQLLIVLQAASPTAMSMNALCQMTGAFPAEVPGLLLAVYCASTVTITAFMTVAITLIR
jgi:hypothetical protein